MRAWKKVLRSWRQPGRALLALLVLSPALARAQTISGTTTQIASGNIRTPSFQAPFVAWVDGSSGDVFYYDQRDGSTHDIGPGSAPSVGGGQIAFVCGAGQNICVYNPATQQTTTMTSDSNDADPALSSEILAWLHYPTPQSYSDIEVMDLSTHQIVSLHYSANSIIVRGSLVMFEQQAASPEQSLYLYDNSTGSTQGIAGAADGFYAWDFDGTHIMYWPALPPGAGTHTTVTDLSGNVIASFPGAGASISGDWVPIITDDNGANSLSLWRWTTGDLFSTNAPPLNWSNGVPPELIIDGAQVVALNSAGQGSNSIYSFAFSSSGSSTVSFSDNFDACTSTTNLGPKWSVDGTWYCKAQHARGEHTRDLALANTVGMQDTDVSALVQLNEDDMSGVAVRAQDDTYYAARLRSSNYVELIRVKSGVVQVLASYPHMISQNVSYTLGLKATGTDPVQLSVHLNGSEVLSYTDSSSPRISSGYAGLMHGTGYRTQYDNFVLSGSAPAFSGSAPPPPPPTDGGTGTPDGGTTTPDAGTGSPDAGTGGADAGSPPTETSFSDDFANCTSTTDLGPNWTIVNGRWYCTGGKARGESASSLALANTASLTDSDVTVRVQFADPSLGSGGLAVRVGGGNYYAAVANAAGNVQLIRVNGANVTELFYVTQTVSAEPSSHRLRLRATGSGPVRLDVWFDGVNIISGADDFSGFLTAGQAGLYNGNNSRTQFEGFSLTGTSAGPMPIGSVTDFVAAGGNGQVALSWMNPTAAYAATRIIQSETGYASSPTPSGDQTIVFDSAGTSTTVTGLAGSTTYFYTAWARDTSGNYSASPATASATTAGSGGTVNFSDSFAECTSTTDLGPNWTIVNGDWYCAGQKARGESAFSLALANTATMAGTDVTARVQLAAASGGSGGIVARASSDGNDYYAVTINTAGTDASGAPAGYVKLIRVNGTNVTDLGVVPESISPEPSSYRIRLRVSGTDPVRLDVWWSGVQIMSVQDKYSGSIASGLSGLFNGAANRGMYNDFSVTSF